MNGSFRLSALGSVVSAAAFVTLHAAPLRAQSYTLQVMIDSLRSGAEAVNMAAINPASARRFDSVATLIAATSGAGALSVGALADVITSQHTRFADVNRWDPRATDFLSQAWFRGALVALVRFANTSLATALDSVAPTRTKGVLAPSDALGRAVRERATGLGAERLRRLEIKYGSNSPRLNLVEAGVNYAFQWIPGLRSGADGAPNRHEFIAAYRTLELTATGSGNTLPNAQLVSAGQFGLRWYHWAATWGQGSVMSRLLRPSYASAGLYVMGPQDEALGRMTGVRRRHGAFFGWGGVHVAYLLESPRRFYVGTDKQLVPHLF